MVFAMSHPVSRKHSTAACFRKRVPDDIQRLAKGKRLVFKLPPEHAGQPELVVTPMIGCEVYFSLRTRDPALVKLRDAAASKQLAAQYRALKNEFRSLNHMERIAFAGLAYPIAAASVRHQLARTRRDASRSEIFRSITSNICPGVIAASYWAMAPADATRK